MNKRFTVGLRIGLSLVLVVAPLLPVAARERTLSSNRPAGRIPAPPPPKSKRLSVSKTKASHARARQEMPKVAGQSATLMADGRWLLVGGDGDSMSTASVFDPEAGEINPLRGGPLNPRMDHSATVLPNGTVLILGGLGAAGQYVDAAEIFNPETETFEAFATSSLSPRAEHSATLLTNGQVLIAGGTDGKGKLSTRVELFDPQKKTTKVLAAKLSSGRNKHVAVLQPDGTVVLSGGSDTNGNNRSDGEIYNPESQTFISTVLPSTKQAELTARLEFSAPDNGSLDVDQNVVIALRFSKPLAVKTFNRQNVVLEGPRGAVPARVVAAEAGMLAFITPLAPLATGSQYNLTINGANDRDGRALPFVALSFKTKECANPPCENTRETRPQIVDWDSWIPDAKNLNGNWRSGRPDSSAQSLPPLQAPAGQTALAGQVLALSGSPLANVTLQIGDQTAVTDHSGRFLLSNLQPGRPVLTIQGHTASRPGKTYGTFDVLVDVAAGKTNRLPYTIWLPVLDDQNAARLPIPTTREIAVTTPRVPGMEVRIPSNAVLRMPPGKHHMHGMTKRELVSLAITPIPVDRPPFPLPPGVSDGLMFTLQLHGARVEGLQGEKRPGLRIAFPNYAQLPAGARVEFWNYDAEAGVGWYLYGHGTVTADRRQVIPDPGVELQSMHCNSLMTSGSVPDGPPGCGGCKDGDPVDLSTGLFLYEKTDFLLPDVIPISLTRTYRQSDTTVRSYGKGSSNPYDMFMYGHPSTFGEIVMPDLGRIRFNKIPNTTPSIYEHTSTPTRFYKATMKMISGVGPNGAWEVKLTDGTIYQFGIKVILGDILGVHASITGLSVIQDRYGHKLIVQRDSDFRMTKVISPNGRWVEFSYSDSSKRISQAKDNIGRTVNYTYDANERLWKVTDPSGGITEYTYDAADRMLTIKDPKGIVYLTNEYNGTTGRVTEQTSADGGVYQFAYTVDTNGKVVQTDVTDPRGHVRRVTFNSSGYSLTNTRALGEPEEQTETYERQTGTNFLMSVTDAMGRVTSYERDSLGNMTSMTRLDGTSGEVTINFTYDPVINQLVTVSDPLGHTTTFTYDRLGNPTRVTDPLNHQTNIAYNKSGQVVSITDALGHSTYFTYVLGDLVEVRDALGRSATRTYDGVGRITRLTNSIGQPIQYQYSNVDTLTKIIDAQSGETTFTYDANGNVLSVTDARGGVTSYTYDNMNRILTRTDPLQGSSSVENYEYDLMGNLVEFTDRRGKVTSYAYDALQRGTFIGYGTTGTPPSATYESTVTYTYDDANRMLQAVDSQAGTVSRTYNDVARTISETTPQGTITNAFDAAGRRTAMTVTGQSTVNYSYDDANRMLSMSQGSATISFGYDNANRRTTLTLPNGIVVAYGYDAASQLTSLTYTNGQTVLGDLAYDYDSLGQRTRMSGSLARSTVRPTVSSATYNAANQQTSFNGQTLTYDANGNLTSDGANTYTWNARNQLTSLSGNNTTSSFTYDALGRRVSKTVDGATTEYLYDRENVIQELSSSTPTANMLAAGVDEVFLRTDANGARSLLADGIGSTLTLTDSSGVSHTNYTYDPFGRTAVSGGGSNNPSQFTNRENDGAGLYYFRARYYSPVLQRFISEDPENFAGGDANLYSYVGNSPVNFVDPSGRIIQLFVIGAGIGAGVGFGMELARQWSACGWSNIDWWKVTAETAGGALSGAISAVPGLGVTGGIIMGGIGGGAGQILKNRMLGRDDSKGLTGAVLLGGLAGGIANKVVPSNAPWPRKPLFDISGGGRRFLRNYTRFEGEFYKDHIRQSIYSGVAGLGGEVGSAIGNRNSGCP